VGRWPGVPLPGVPLLAERCPAGQLPMEGRPCSHSLVELPSLALEQADSKYGAQVLTAASSRSALQLTLSPTELWLWFPSPVVQSLSNSSPGLGS
jgi:hypothetical protein